MALYLLDTTTFTLFQYAHPRVVAAIAAHSADTVGVTTVTVDEVLTGWHTRERRAKTNAERATAARVMGEAVTLLGVFPISPSTETALDSYDCLRRLRLNVGGNDLRIAAVALELGATVVTNNLRDFARVPGLLVEDWSA